MKDIKESKMVETANLDKELDAFVKESLSGELWYDYYGQKIFVKDKDYGNQLIADIRGWGTIQKEEHATQKQDAIGEFIVQAIKEKLERESKPNHNVLRREGN